MSAPRERDARAPHGSLPELKKRSTAAKGRGAALTPTRTTSASHDAARSPRAQDDVTGEPRSRVLESPYNKALEDARPTTVGDRRQKQLELEAEEKKSKVPWTTAERYKRQQKMEAEVEAEIVEKAQKGAEQKMEALKKTYSGEYGETLEKVVDEGMGGNAAKEAKALLGRGYLKP